MSGTEPICCTPRSLPEHHEVAGIQQAVAVNPANMPPRAAVAMMTALAGAPLPPGHLAMQVSRYWGAGKCRLTVGWLDGPDATTRRLIMQHLNRWGEFSGIRFVESKRSPIVRIARHPEDGHYSYVGTNNLLVRDGPTMNLAGFNRNTPLSEYRRVVGHEGGHAAGFDHEHLRRKLVEEIDPAKAIPFYGRWQGWDELTVRAQVLTPLPEDDLLATPGADERSIMCYEIPGEITYSGRPIVGGVDFSTGDRELAARLYPKK
jgi:hypothetical protein